MKKSDSCHMVPKRYYLVERENTDLCYLQGPKHAEICYLIKPNPYKSPSTITWNMLCPEKAWQIWSMVGRSGQNTKSPSQTHWYTHIQTALSPQRARPVPMLCLKTGRLMYTPSVNIWYYRAELRDTLFREFRKRRLLSWQKTLTWFACPCTPNVIIRSMEPIISLTIDIIFVFTNRQDYCYHNHHHLIKAINTATVIKTINSAMAVTFISIVNVINAIVMTFKSAMVVPIIISIQTIFDMVTMTTIYYIQNTRGTTKL